MADFGRISVGLRSRSLYQNGIEINVVAQWPLQATLPRWTRYARGQNGLFADSQIDK